MTFAIKEKVLPAISFFSAQKEIVQKPFRTIPCLPKRFFAQFGL